MIEHIIAVSDIHVRNFKRVEETKEYFEKFIDFCNKFVQENGREETRIVLAGDIFDQKITVSNESTLMVSWLLRELNSIAKTIVICGNHDYLMNNASRVCSLTPVFTMSQFEDCHYLDMEFEYISDCLVDDNIVWCLFSTFEDFNRPEIESYKKQFPDNTFVGLIHADINGAKTDVGRCTENGLDLTHFKGLDFVIAGHIHKRQELKKGGVKVVYCGSLMQQNMGENLSGHGGVIWNVRERTYTAFDIDKGEYGYYKFAINDIEEIDSNKEKLLNL